jgi:hypothetical protein
VRVIKLAFISFLILFLVVTIISLFIPSRVLVSRAMKMRAPKEEVMAQLSDPAKWKAWFPGTESAGFYLEDKVVKGLMINEQTKRYLKLRQIKSDGVVAEYNGIPQKKVVTGWNIIPEATTDSVSVQWYMEFSLRWYPWEKFASLVFEKQYGPTMEQGLTRLKSIVEK